MSALQAIGGWAGLAGWATAVVGPFLVWLGSRRKADIDESAVILGKWKELVEAHEAAIKRLTEDFHAQRKRWDEENEALRKRVRDLEGEGRAKDAKIKALEDEVVGLKRAIAQNSQSAAFQLGRTGEPKKTRETGNRTTADIVREINADNGGEK